MAHLSVAEVAELVGVTEEAVRHRLRHGLLDGERNQIGRREVWAVDADAAQRWARRRSAEQVLGAPRSARGGIRSRGGVPLHGSGGDRPAHSRRRGRTEQLPRGLEEALERMVARGAQEAGLTVSYESAALNRPVYAHPAPTAVRAPAPLPEPDRAPRPAGVALEAEVVALEAEVVVLRREVARLRAALQALLSGD